MNYYDYIDTWKRAQLSTKEIARDGFSIVMCIFVVHGAIKSAGNDKMLRETRAKCVAKMSTSFAVAKVTLK